MREASRNQTALLSFVMVFAAILINAGLTYVNLRGLQRTIARVSESHEVLEELESLQRTIIDAETGQRGFIITGEAKYLEPYREAAARVEEETRRLADQLEDNPAQQERYRTLKPLIEKRMALIQRGIGLRQEEGYEAGRSFLVEGEGVVVMDSIRRSIREMEDHERARLAKRDTEAEWSFWSALVTSFITAALGVALVGIGFLLVARDIARREEMNQEMQRTMETLEERVRERTAEIADANVFLRAEVLERRNAEEQARQFSAELQRSNRELEQFASVASHDLQEPLRKIQAFGDRLKAKFRAELSEQGQDYLDRMLASAARMRKLIDDLLVFSRVATNYKPFAAVNLQEVVNDVVNDLEERLHQSRGRIEVDELATVAADPLQMRQLFLNLLGNALKFQRPGVPPVVKISGRLVEEHSKPLEGDEQSFFEVTVEDNGIGFEQVYVDRIFELFQRLHGREEYEGTGMGLAICRKIVERHGGRITALSAPGQGARFVVTLPLEQAAEGVSA